MTCIHPPFNQAPAANTIFSRNTAARNYINSLQFFLPSKRSFAVSRKLQPFGVKNKKQSTGSQSHRNFLYNFSILCILLYPHFFYLSNIAYFHAKNQFQRKGGHFPHVFSQTETFIVSPLTLQPRSHYRMEFCAQRKTPKKLAKGFQPEASLPLSPGYPAKPDSGNREWGLGNLPFAVCASFSRFACCVEIVVSNHRFVFPRSDYKQQIPLSLFPIPQSVKCQSPKKALCSCGTDTYALI